MPTSAPATFIELMPLAEGGMGRVCLVLKREGAFERLFALKRLRWDLNGDPEAREMFLREARLAGLVRHPNVVSALGAGEDEEGPYLLMEFVEGVSAARLMSRSRHAHSILPVPVCLSIVKQLTLALHALHTVRAPDGKRLNLVHRDVSPQNILIGFDGVVRLADLGVAKVLEETSRTQAGLLKGKRGYLAPEQILFREVDARADLFAVGIVLFELLAGRRLFPEGPTQILSPDFPDIGEERPDASASLVELLFELLAPEPEHRIASAAEVARRLEAVAQDYPEAFDLAQFVSEFCQEDRERLQADVSKAVQDWKASAQETRAASKHSLRRTLLAAGLGGGAVLALGSGRLWLARSRTRPTPAVQPPPPITIAAPDAASLAAPSVDAAAAPAPAAAAPPKHTAPGGRARRSKTATEQPPKANPKKDVQMWRQWP